MAGILDQILQHKRNELAAQQAALPLAELQAAISDVAPPRDILASLRAGGPIAVIAEVKRQSPSKGLLRADFNPVSIAKDYAVGGASALSVLTDQRFFGGALDYLTRIRQAVTLPLLRKDFIIDPYQIYQSRAAGADALLLIVAALEYDRLRQLLDLTHELGMRVLVETHTAQELEIALDLGAALIGINNRDLATFHTDLAVTEKLALRVGSTALLVSESGVHTHADIQRLAASGVHAVLVGESLVRQTDVSMAVRQLLGKCDPLMSADFS